MAIWNLGSINADYVYSLPHIPAPGETLGALGRQTYLGGKGTNMSVAAARAGAHVHHIGAVGNGGRWAVDRLTEYGVDTRCVSELACDTGHAIIMVAEDGENTIIIHPGANVQIPMDQVQQALSSASVGDWIVAQNETNLQSETLGLGREMGLKVAYAAAPFSAEAVEAVLPFIDFLILNEIEMKQLTSTTGRSVSKLGVPIVIVTRGGDGCDLYRDGALTRFPAIKVDVVDTTGAGDTFTGYVLAALDRKASIEEAIDLATRAGALMVMRHGTADVIPDLKEVLDFHV